MCTRNGSGRTRHALWSYIKCQKISYLMRDAIHVQKFRHCSTSLVADEIITASVAREVVTQKALQKSALSVSKTAMVGMRRVGLPQRLAALQESPGASTSRS